MPLTRYGPDYREEATLRDGTPIVLRMIGPDDKEKLRAGLSALSPQSRYRRFFTPKTRFTAGELRYLTELDGIDHFAIGATKLLEDGTEGEGLGVGRVVRLPDEPKVADPAVAVVDAAQGQGLGRMLLQRIMEAAVERDITAFRSEFLAENTAMRNLLRKLSPNASFVGDGPIVVADFPLPGAASDDQQTESRTADLMRAFATVAEHTIAVRRAFELLFDPETVKTGWEQLKRELWPRR